MLEFALLLALQQPQQPAPPQGNSEVVIEAVDIHGHILPSMTIWEPGITDLVGTEFTVFLEGPVDRRGTIGIEKPRARFGDLPEGSYKLRVDLPYEITPLSFRMPDSDGKTIRVVVQPHHRLEEVEQDEGIFWQLEFRTVGGWGYESTLYLYRDFSGVVHADIESGGKEASEQLSPGQSKLLLRLIAASRLLTGGEAAGQSYTGGDGEYTVLRFQKKVIVLVVVTGNPSFARQGPRKELAELLAKINLRLFKRARKQPQ